MPLKPEVLKGWPPGGWQYYQPQTNWEAPTPLQVTFDQQVKNIVTMRTRNPQFKLSTDYMVAATDLEKFTEKRIGSHPKYCIGPEAVAAQKKTPSPSFPSRALQAAARVVLGNENADPRALEEWLGSGKRPVEAQVSERRATVCAFCPANSSSSVCPDPQRNSWRRWVTKPVANAIRKYMAIRHSMNLSTTRDSELGKCLACHCELQLKIHSPIDHIRSNLSPETVAELRRYPDCWVMSE